jgi:hypothetical protein
MKNIDWVRTLSDKYNEGYSDVEICREVGITVKQFSKLYESNDKFAELVDFGRTLSHAWWMEKARKNLNERTFNTSLYVMVMKNRYGWAEKLEATAVDPNDAQSVKELRARLEKELPRLVKELSPSLADSSLLDKVQEVMDATA